jgi:hypothetical protein
MEGLRPSCSTHVRESPRTWGTRPGGKAWWQTRKAEDELTAWTEQSIASWFGEVFNSGRMIVKSVHSCAWRQYSGFIAKGLCGTLLETNVLHIVEQEGVSRIPDAHPAF